MWLYNTCLIVSVFVVWWSLTMRETLSNNKINEAFCLDLSISVSISISISIYTPMRTSFKGIMSVTAYNAGAYFARFHVARKPLAVRDWPFFAFPRYPFHTVFEIIIFVLHTINNSVLEIWKPLCIHHSYAPAMYFIESLSTKCAYAISIGTC